MSKSPAGHMPAEEFDRVASNLNWEARSLGVVRAMLVEGKDSATAAATAVPVMTVNQAGVLRRRFKAKADEVGKKKLSAEAFMQTVKPEGVAALEPFKRELLQLRRNNYTNDQLLLYLSENGIQTTEATLDQFLTKAK